MADTDSHQRREVIDTAGVFVAGLALIVSIIILFWSKGSTEAARTSADAAVKANKLSSQANLIASNAAAAANRQAMFAQANKILFDYFFSGNSIYLRVGNFSATAIHRVYFTYGAKSPSGSYVYVNLLEPCSEWQAQVPHGVTAQLFFDDSQGYHWNITNNDLVRLQPNPPSFSGQVNATSSWHSTMSSVSCA